jgi:hypothetical protein
MSDHQKRLIMASLTGVVMAFSVLTLAYQVSNVVADLIVNRLFQEVSEVDLGSSHDCKQ